MSKFKKIISVSILSIFLVFHANPKLYSQGKLIRESDTSFILNINVPQFKYREVKKGNFIEDLFYRLNVGNINIPPLRERKEDIPVLAYAFLNEFSQKFDKQIKRIDPAALELLQSYYWKGNIRELRNVMERVTLLLEEDELKDRHFQFLIPQGHTEIKHGKDEFVLKVPSKGIKIEVVLRKLIEDTLKITNGNQVKAAEVLGLSRSKLRYRMEQLGIEVTRKVTS